MTLGIAFLAGLISCLSPCVLPVVPVFTGYVAGGAGGSAGTVVLGGSTWRAAGFLAGFLGVFVLLWISLGLVGFALFQTVPILRQASGALIVAMGLLTMSGRHPLARLGGLAPWLGGGGPVLLGAGVAVGWTPCIGPTLGAILTLAAAAPTVGVGSLLLVAYALGLGVPFVALALGFRRFRRLASWLGARARGVEIVTGAWIALVGALVYSGTFARLAGLFRWGY